LKFDVGLIRRSHRPTRRKEASYKAQRAVVRIDQELYPRTKFIDFGDDLICVVHRMGQDIGPVLCIPSRSSALHGSSLTLPIEATITAIETRIGPNPCFQRYRRMAVTTPESMQMISFPQGTGDQQNINYSWPAGRIAEVRDIAAVFAPGAAGTHLGIAGLLCPEAATSELHRDALRHAHSKAKFV
jgi:murein tripeptide amidase MpaA